MVYAVIIYLLYLSILVGRRNLRPSPWSSFFSTIILMLVTTRNLVPGPPCAYVTVGRGGRIAPPARLCYLREQCPAWVHLEDPVPPAVVFKAIPQGRCPYPLFCEYFGDSFRLCDEFETPDHPMRMSGRGGRMPSAAHDLPFLVEPNI